MKKLCKTEGCGEHETSEFYHNRSGLMPICKKCTKKRRAILAQKEGRSKPKCINCDETDPNEFHNSKYSHTGKQNICKSCRAKVNLLQRIKRENLETKEAKMSRIKTQLNMYWSEYYGKDSKD